MIRVYVRILAKYKKTTLVECRTIEPKVWYEFSSQWNIRYRFELNEWETAKSLYKRRLEIYARRSIRRWLKPGQTLEPLPPWPLYHEMPKEEVTEEVAPQENVREGVRNE